MTELVPEYDGCEWPLDPGCFSDEWTSYGEAVRQRAWALASSSMRALTAYRVGGCPITVRPCKPNVPCILPSYDAWIAAGGWMAPGITADGLWVNSCGCGGPCSCSALCEVRLPAPIGEVYSVKVGGAELPLTDFRIDNRRILVYTGTGDCPFAATQDLNLPDTAPDTWSVTYLNAYPVDQNGAYAAARLALEFAKACEGKNCKLPAGVSQVVRQGVSFTVNTGLFSEGVTGIREIDAYISTVNPDKRKSQTKIWYPGMNRPRVSAPVTNTP